MTSGSGPGLTCPPRVSWPLATQGEGVEWLQEPVLGKVGVLRVQLRWEAATDSFCVIPALSERDGALPWRGTGRRTSPAARPVSSTETECGKPALVLRSLVQDELTLYEYTASGEPAHPGERLGLTPCACERGCHFCPFL